jgi:formylglycine-generating enzyme required for sulfatase activity
VSADRTVVQVPAGVHVLGPGRTRIELSAFALSASALTVAEVVACVNARGGEDEDETYRFVNWVNHHLPYQRLADGTITIRERFSGSDRAAGVTFAGAVLCCEALGGRLPNEAEWEASVRMASSGPRAMHDWQDFRQWCGDIYHPDLPYALATGTAVPDTEMRVVRGGSYNRDELDVVWSRRAGKWIWHGGDATGVRVLYEREF